MSHPVPSILHSTTVAWQGRGVLIRGASGSGKSGLALQLMAFGADLVADDRTHLVGEGHELMASAPEAGAGMIEARQIGLVRTGAVGPVPIRLAVDLDLSADLRLPPPRTTCLAGHAVPLIAGKGAPNLAAAILACLRGDLVPVE